MHDSESKPLGKIWRRLPLAGMPLIALLLAACSLFGTSAEVVSYPYAQSESATPLPQAEITFRVTLPEDTPSGGDIQLILLDEVTGLPFNPQHYDMHRDDSLHYQITLQAPVGSVIKYRYAHNDEALMAEHTADGGAVRYRLYAVDGPGTVEDIVARWESTPTPTQTGRIVGEALQIESGAPIPNLLVAAGGQTALTASDGSFILDGLPPGKHMLVGYALDGSYQPFKQEAVVAPLSATPVSLSMQPSAWVEVTFTVSLPSDTVPTVPVRLVGNLLQLGNTYADLYGGASVLANRAPTLQPLPDGRYTLTLRLPAGIDLRYKYSMGDGLWNAEHAADGSYLVRQLIVPTGVSTWAVEDTVSSWKSEGLSPVWFDLSVPEDTPSGEAVYIQFKLYRWMAPLPMWPAEAGRWTYRLASPLNIPGSLPYHYCLNAQCGGEDGLALDSDAEGRAVDLAASAGTLLNDTVTQWLDAPSEGNAASTGLQRRAAGFIAGIELAPSYHPSWQPYLADALQEIEGLNANWVVLTPTWTFSGDELPALALEPGQDSLWQDLAETISAAQALGLKVAIYPQVNFPADAETWWLEKSDHPAWWAVWFERYHTFLIHHADLAQRQGADMLIVGGDWLAPALPGGTLPDGIPSGLPEDVEARWHTLADDLDARFEGALTWALPFPDGLANLPPFLSDYDQIYLEWSDPLGTQEVPAPINELAAQIGEQLDQLAQPLQSALGKPLLLGVASPSSASAADCLIPGDNACLEPALVDLQRQVEAYTAVFEAVNQRTWISGLISQGFYPPLALADASASIRGKPAAAQLAAALAVWTGGGE